MLPVSPLCRCGSKALQVSTDYVLQVEGLYKEFVLGRWGWRRIVRAVNDFNLSLRRGEVIALVGESGSGKTTVARVIARFTSLRPAGSSSTRKCPAKMSWGASGLPPQSPDDFSRPLFSKSLHSKVGTHFPRPSKSTAWLRGRKRTKRLRPCWSAAALLRRSCSSTSSP